MASTDELERFAKEISKEPFGIAKYAPEPWGQQRICFENVAQKVARVGGSAIYGWMFQLKIPMVGEYFIAIHHALWRSKSGQLFDVTPYNEDRNHHPLQEDGGTLIVVDSKSKPVQTEKIKFGPLPSKFYPIDKTPELIAHVEKLRQNEIEYCNQLYGQFE